MFFPSKPRRQYQAPQQNMYPQPPFQNPMHWQQPQQQPPHPPPQQPQQFQQGQQPMQGGFPSPGPYPQQPYGKQKSISLTNAFKNEEGKFDFEKTSTTIDQVMKVGNQISPIVKQVGGLFTKKT